MKILLKNVTVHGILLDAIFDQDNEDKRETVRLVAEGIQSGCVKPLPMTIFPHDRVDEAFRFMASGKHIGKVIIQVREEHIDKIEVKSQTEKDEEKIEAISRAYFDPQKSFIIVGGLGGFGLELANWLVSRGVSKLVLVSRSGVKTGYQELCIRNWRESGNSVLISKDDVTTYEGTLSLIQNSINYFGGAEIGGIFNLAMILKDGFMENQTVETFSVVSSPKVDATIHLDKISRVFAKKLEYFVVFSSMSCGRGNAGQGNYGLANSVTERICEMRVGDGLPGLAIQVSQ